MQYNFMTDSNRIQCQVIKQTSYTDGTMDWKSTMVTKLLSTLTLDAYYDTEQR